uniref:hypothetical protein n=1 Tax=Anaerococcus mediterraneensis TaxID=1870984 RepID=UPI000930D59E|nr:hypothetical protein [Anaerococcus mediterraneensis]
MKPYRHIAKNVNDWVRLEAEFSSDYAHQITDMILECKNDKELKEVLLCSILSRYMFFYARSNKPHKITKLMIDELEDMNYTLSLPSPRDNDLDRSIEYIINNSGLFSIFYKIQYLYGFDELYDFIIFLVDEYKKYTVKDDVLIWLKKHEKNYLGKAPPWRKDGE